jgi:hypothetical protein
MLIEFSKYKNLNSKFLSMDDEKTFNFNLKTMPENWIWRTKEISYVTNSQGYRCKEFNNVNWNNYFLTFGDSNVFGIGSSEDLIFPNIVSSHLSIEPVNLGIPGCGTDTIFYNIINILTNINHFPKFIVISWPNIFRKIWFQEDSSYLWIPQLSHTDSLHKKFDDLSLSISTEELHVKQEWLYRRNAIKLLCEIKGIKLIEFVMPYESINYADISDLIKIDIEEEEKIDYNNSQYFNKIRARDYSKKYGSHYGPAYHQMISDYIIKNV